MWLHNELINQKCGYKCSSSNDGNLVIFLGLRHYTHRVKGSLFVSRLVMGSVNIIEGSSRHSRNHVKHTQGKKLTYIENTHTMKVYLNIQKS